MLGRVTSLRARLLRLKSTPQDGTPPHHFQHYLFNGL
jgi:hypothetical protein